MTSHTRTVRITALGITVAYTAVLYLSGGPGDSSPRLVAYLPSAAVVVGIVWDVWAWKWPLLHRLANRPLIRGTWQTTIMPHEKSDIPDGGNRGPITGATLIEQTFWTLSVTLMTEESESHSKVAAITPTNVDSKDRKILHYTYSNEPRMEQRPRSFVHRGSSQATIIGLRPDKMAGTYWTDRLTMGSLDLRLLSRRTTYTSLESALEATEPPSRWRRRRGPLSRSS